MSMTAGMGGALNLGTLAVSVVANTQHFERRMEKVDRRFALSNKNMMRSAAAAAESIGRSLTRISLGMGALVGTGVRSLGKFEDSFAQTRTMFMSASEDQLKAIDRMSRSMSMKWGKSATDMMDGFYFLGASGMDAAQSLAVFGKAVEASAGGNMELAKVVSLGTDALNAMGMASKDAGKNAKNFTRVLDVLIRSNQLGDVTASEVATSLSRVAASARMAGLSIEQTSAMITVFGQSGIKGERAGSQLRSMLEGVQQAAMRNAEFWEGQGIPVFDEATGAFRGMADILENLEEQFDGLSHQQSVSRMMQMGLNEIAAQTIRTLMGQSGSLRETTKALEDAAGTAKTFADVMQDSLGLQLSRAYQISIEFTRQLAGHFIPAIDSVIERLDKWGDKMGEAESMVERAAATTAVWTKKIFYLTAGFVGLKITKTIIATAISLGKIFMGTAVAMKLAAGAVGLYTSALVKLVLGLKTSKSLVGLAGTGLTFYQWETKKAGLKTMLLHKAHLKLIAALKMTALKAIPAVATAMGGFFAGKWIGEKTGLHDRLAELLNDMSLINREAREMGIEQIAPGVFATQFDPEAGKRFAERQKRIAQNLAKAAREQERLNARLEQEEEIRKRITAATAKATRENQAHADMVEYLSGKGREVMRTLEQTVALEQTRLMYGGEAATRMEEQIDKGSRLREILGDMGDSADRLGARYSRYVELIDREISLRRQLRFDEMTKGVREQAKYYAIAANKGAAFADTWLRVREATRDAAGLPEDKRRELLWEVGLREKARKAWEETLDHTRQTAERFTASIFSAGNFWGRMLQAGVESGRDAPSVMKTGGELSAILNKRMTELNSTSKTSDQSLRGIHNGIQTLVGLVRTGGSSVWMY